MPLHTLCRSFFWVAQLSLSLCGVWIPPIPNAQLCTDLFRHAKCTSITSSLMESGGLIEFFVHLQWRPITFCWPSTTSASRCTLTSINTLNPPVKASRGNSTVLYSNHWKTFKSMQPSGHTQQNEVEAPQQDGTDTNKPFSCLCFTALTTPSSDLVCYNW